jgi:hypothetical protein
MSTRQQVTEGLGVAYHGDKVHLEVSKHLDSEMSVYLTGAILMAPDVARALAAALIEMADLVPEAVPA